MRRGKALNRSDLNIPAHLVALRPDSEVVALAGGISGGQGNGVRNQPAPRSRDLGK